MNCIHGIDVFLDCSDCNISKLAAERDALANKFIAVIAELTEQVIALTAERDQLEGEGIAAARMVVALTEDYDKACAEVAALTLKLAGAEAELTLTDDVKWILSKPNFWCGPIAHRLVALGIAKIASRSEDEQAYVLHWLLGLHRKYGATFREEADKILAPPPSSKAAE